LVEGLAETLLAYGAIFNGSSKLLSWVGPVLIASKISTSSPFGEVFVFNRFGDTVLLGVGNCLISFVGVSAESFNLGVVV